MGPAEELEDPGVETLDPDRESIHAEAREGPDLLLVEALGVGFQGDLTGRAPEARHALQLVEEASERLARIQGGGAPSHEHGLRLPRSPPPGFLQDDLEGPIDVLALGDQGVEVAVGAHRHAEGKVHVQGGAGLGHLLRGPASSGLRGRGFRGSSGGARHRPHGSKADWGRRSDSCRARGDPPPPPPC